MMTSGTSHIWRQRVPHCKLGVTVHVVVCSIFVFRRRTSGGGNGCSGIMGQESHAIEGHIEERQANEPSLVSTF